jgi:hypothetical protein
MTLRWSPYKAGPLDTNPGVPTMRATKDTTGNCFDRPPLTVLTDRRKTMDNCIDRPPITVLTNRRRKPGAIALADSSNCIDKVGGGVGSEQPKDSLLKLNLLVMCFCQITVRVVIRSLTLRLLRRPGNPISGPETLVCIRQMMFWMRGPPRQTTTLFQKIGFCLGTPSLIKRPGKTNKSRFF